MNNAHSNSASGSDIKTARFDRMIAHAAVDRSLGYIAGARAWIEEAIGIDEERPEGWHNLSQIESEAGMFEKARESACKALNLAAPMVMANRLEMKTYRQISLNLSTLLLRQQEFDAGWPLWETGRFGMSWAPVHRTAPWQGEPGPIAVICEGGYGDAFLFRRWLPLLAHDHEITLILWHRLAQWCDWRDRGVARVIPLPSGVKSVDLNDAISRTLTAGIKYSVSWMSLPYWFGMNHAQKIPADRMMEGTRLRLQIQQVRSINPRIGFCWHAEEAGTQRRVRTLDQNMAQAVADHLGRYGEVFSLVPVGSDYGIHKPGQAHRLNGVEQDDEAIDSWEKTTDYIRSMDAVVSVDTAVAHLAGLIGVPTLTLLPLRSEWKWFTADSHGNRTPWWPSMRLYRSALMNGWEMEGIQAAIDGMMNSSSGSNS
jgi:hypothetical protein